MKILLTGAAGFIGSHLSQKLLSLGHQVIGIDNFDPFYSLTIKEENLSALTEHSKFSFYRGDLADKKFVSSYFDSDIDVVVHLAAKAGVRPSIEDPQAYINANILATLQILEVMKEKGLEKIVFASSSSVYGKNEEIPFTEDQPTPNIMSPYAYTKKSCEDLLKLYFNIFNISSLSLRLFTVYGPRQRPDLAIHKLMKLMHEGKELTIFGDGTMKRDYTYVDDIVSGFLGAIERIIGTKDKLYEVYNLGNENPISLKELLSKFEAVTNIKPNVKYSEVPLGDVPVTYADIKRAKKYLNYKPETEFSEGLKKFYEWFKTYYKSGEQDAA